MATSQERMNQTLERMVEHINLQNENDEENEYEESDNELENQEVKLPVLNQVRIARQNKNDVQPNRYINKNVQDNCAQQLNQSALNL